MSLPLDPQPLRDLHQLVLETAAKVLRGIDLIAAYAECNCDNETGRDVIVKQATSIAYLSYQLAFLAGRTDQMPRPLQLDDCPLPPSPTDEQLARAIHSGACRHIADLAGFTGNLARIKDPSMRRKVAELFRDFALNLAAEMTVQGIAAAANQPEIKRLMTTAATLPAPSASSPHDYLKTVDLMTRFAHGSNRLAELQLQIDTVMLGAAEDMQTEFTLLQEEQGTIEAELERLARLHPEWFVKKASLTTPVGVCKLTATTQLLIPDQELAIALLDKHFPDTANLYKKTEVTLRKEALEALEDDDLKKLKITRVRGKSFKVTPAKVSLGDAVAKAKEVRK